MCIQHPPEAERFVLQRLPALSGKRVLDAGSGKGLYGYLCRATPGGEAAYVVGTDVYRPYVEFCRRYGPYDALTLTDLAQGLPFRTDSFDIVLVCDLIEHLDRDAGERLLDDVERVARERVVLTCPNGDQLRGPVEDIASEAHLSTWRSSDFRKRGYEVRGIGTRLKPRNDRLALALWYVMTPLAIRVPAVSDCLVAVKGMKA